MRDWSLTPGDPLCLTLAGDSRLSIPDYLNDHSWELEFGGAEPAALALHTSYGLRAKAMRTFLRFGEGKMIVSDPAASFVLPPGIRRFYPNFLIVEYSPLPNIDVSTEYWVPQSNAIGGRVTLANKSNATRKIRLEVCALLAPIDGQSMTSAVSWPRGMALTAWSPISNFMVRKSRSETPNRPSPIFNRKPRTPRGV